MHVGPFTITLPLRKTERDPYWDLFINMAPDDPNNIAAEAVRRLPEGNVFPVTTDIHSPAITSGHVKEFARFLGAGACGILRLGRPSDDDAYPFGIVCTLPAEYDPRQARGVGGQTPVLRGAFVNFVLGAWVRECGYQATRTSDADGERLAVQAGLGRQDADGNLVSLRGATRLYVADMLRTDLPLAPDGEVVR